MKLLLVDGMALLYRAHFAMIRSPLRDSRGRNTSAIFGFARVMLSLLEKERPTHWAVAFDTPAPTFRHKEFEDYKAHRPPMPEDLVAQLDDVRALLLAMRVALLERDGFEADDIMASLADRVGREGGAVRLFSSDKDLLQVVSENVHALLPQSGGEQALELGPAGVHEHWGVGPEHIVDVLALMGDSVDNIPGVRGIGEKTAVKLMSQHQSLEHLYESLEAITPPGVREKLREGRESAFRSRDLVRLDLASAADIPVEGLRLAAMDAPRLADLCKGWQFRRLEARFRGLEPHAHDDEWMDHSAASMNVASHPEMGSAPAPAGAPAGLVRAERPAEAVAALAALQRDSHAGIEFLPAHSGRAGEVPDWILLQGTSVSLAIHFPSVRGDSALSEAMRDFLSSGPALTCGDARAAARWLGGAGFPAPRVEHDLGIASHLMEMSGQGRAEVLGEAIEDLPQAGENLSFDFGDSGPPLERVAAMLRHRLAEAPRLLSALEARAEGGLYRDLELPLTRVVAEMEETGVLVDRAVLAELSKRFGTELEALQTEIHRLAGTEFNVLSTKQLAHVLFEKHRLPAGRKTKTGYSTDSEVLEELALTYELPGKVLEFRQLSKLLSTYVDALPTMIQPSTGRIHARFHQALVPTGRFSSSDPNLQNIPIRTPQGREIRRAFITDPGWKLISADYSQIELRVMAHLSSEPAFVSAFAEGQDIHARTASEVFGVPLAEVTPEQRGRAKTINFGLMYGMGAQSLGRQLRIPVKEAADFIERYFARLPRVREFRERLIEDAKSSGFVTTLMGRRISLPSLASGDRRMAAGAERAALNAPLQGSAADLIKRAMCDLDAEIRRLALPARLLIQVHDELVLECDASRLEEVEAVARRCMERAAELAVPLTATVGAGDNWNEIH